MSSSGDYDYLKREDSKRKIRKNQLKDEITELQEEGIVIAEKKVKNYMHELGI